MLDIAAYIVVGLVLYFVSDWILNQIEIKRGERFQNRSLVFFAIIMLLALVSFELLKRL
ncbi:MAG TPA: hypothetical protein PLZ16_03905 [Gammaproteobacteria bacterium]|nr:hypothetical protein [Gammaproteobacteria bacterium]